MVDWKKVYFGKINKEQTLNAVKDSYWQSIRLSMKGKSLQEKYNILYCYVYDNFKALENGLISDGEWRKVKIRSTNYVTALSRGGLIKPSDYR